MLEVEEDSGTEGRVEQGTQIKTASWPNLEVNREERREYTVTYV